MHYNLLKYFSFAVSMLLLFSCTDAPKKKTILQESMLSLKVKTEQGTNIDPITGDTLLFAGFPGAIAYYEDNPDVPFIIIGKELKAKKSYKCNFYGALNVQLETRKLQYVFAYPIEPKNQTVVPLSYQDLNTNHTALKLWLRDWFSNAFDSKGLKNVTWSAETDVYRKILK